MEYRYFLLKNCWIARLERGRNTLESKEFFENGVWQFDEELNLKLNDSIMDYGDCSVFDYDELSKDEAKRYYDSIEQVPTADEILVAKHCFVFGSKTLYIEVSENADLFVYSFDDKKWSKKNNDSFWFALDLEPEIYLPISNEEALLKIRTNEGNHSLNVQNKDVCIINNKDKTVHQRANCSFVSGVDISLNKYCEALERLREKYISDESALDEISRARETVTYYFNKGEFDKANSCILQLEAFLQDWY